MLMEGILNKFLLLIFCSILVISCSTVSKKEQDEAKNYYEAGTTALVQGSHTTALEKLLKAAEYNPKDPFIQNNLALAYQIKKFYKKAEFHFLRALELREDFSDAQNNLGALYIKMKKWDEAIKYCEMAVTNPLYRTPEKAYSNIGRAYYNLKNYKQAIRYQKKAIEYDSEFCYAHTSLGQARMKNEQYDKASYALKQAISLCKTYEAPYYVLGLNYVKAKRPSLAIKQFNVLIRRFPEGKYHAKAKRIIKILRSK